MTLTTTHTMTTRIPHLLAPYVRIPAEGSLTLLTSVLDATTNWLVLRYLHACLKPSSGGPGFESETADAAEDVGVVLLSFMRDQAFWKDGASRLVRIYVPRVHLPMLLCE